MIYFSTFATCSQLLWVIRIQVSILTGCSVVGQHSRSIQKAGISIFGIVQVNREASLRSSARRIRFSYPGELKQALGILSGEVGNLLVLQRWLIFWKCLSAVVATGVIDHISEHYLFLQITRFGQKVSAGRVLEISKWWRQTMVWETFSKVEMMFPSHDNPLCLLNSEGSSPNLVFALAPRQTSNRLRLNDELFNRRTWRYDQIYL